MKSTNRYNTKTRIRRTASILSTYARPTVTTLRILKSQKMGLSSIFGGGAPSQQKDTATSAKTASNPIANELKNQIAQELAVANATELVNKISENCFEKCLTSPYTSRNDPCIDQCLAKYMRSWNVISKAYITRIQNASASGEI